MSVQTDGRIQGANIKCLSGQTVRRATLVVEPGEHDAWQLVGEKQVFPSWMWMNVSGRMDSGVSSREHGE